MPSGVEPTSDSNTVERAEAIANERAMAEVLGAEYALLMAALGAAWSASLTRTSLFLGVVSAAGIALGLVAGEGLAGQTFVTVALVVLPLTLFLGVATFVRLVQVQRESMVYLTGLNRIRAFQARRVPDVVPYLVLPTHDDEAALYRSVGTGMNVRPPRHRLPFLLAQTQGIVGVVTAVIAGAIAAIAGTVLGPLMGWVCAIAAAVVTITALFRYWQGSLAELRSSIRPLHPGTPQEPPWAT